MLPDKNWRSKMKKLSAIILMLSMLFSISIPVAAAENTNTINYTIYDENGVFVEKGILSTNSNARINWTSVTLASGQIAVFRDSGYAFMKYNGSSMTFSYTLSSSATVVCSIRKTSTSTGSGSVWSSTTKTGSSGTISKTANESTYYYPTITNSGTRSITITSASFN